MEQPTLVPDAPESPVPDTEDWTWALRRPCPECGLVVRDVHPRELATSLRAVAATWQGVLGGTGAALRERPRPGTWSPLEYGAHVRDVLVNGDERVGLLLTQDDPVFADWDQDAAALADRYDQQDPRAVTGALLEAGRALAARLDGVAGTSWDRPGRRSDGSSSTVASLARYVLHDVAHHLRDVRR